MEEINDGLLTDEEVRVHERSIRRRDGAKFFDPAGEDHCHKNHGLCPMNNGLECYVWDRCLKEKPVTAEEAVEEAANKDDSEKPRVVTFTGSAVATMSDRIPDAIAGAVMKI